MTITPDSALTLKENFDRGMISGYKQAKKYLNESELFAELLVDFDIKILNLVWRLSQLSEIPFAGGNPKIQKWIKKLVELTLTEEGFSLTGKPEYILPCYNAIITSILIKLGYKNKEVISSGINWIMKYQKIERNSDYLWKGSGAQKYGGCLKSVPCYIGVVKSVIALSEYKKYYYASKEIDKKLRKGIEYILEHEIYKRKSDNEPITNYITQIAYPFSYKTNIIEILRLIKENKKLGDPRCLPALELLSQKRKKDGFWRPQKQYISGIWISFDKKIPHWTAYIINSILPGRTN